MPRDPSTGVYTRVSNTFSNPVIGDIIAPDAADAFFDDLTDALNDIPQIATTGPIYYFELLNDSGAVDQSSSVVTQLAFCKTNGITHAVLPPYFMWFENITVDFPIHIEGSPVQVAKGNLDEGEPSQYGTRIIAKTGSNSHFNIPAGSNGVTISGICFLQDQPASAPGFVPDVYPPCIQNNSAWTLITRNSFWAVYDGVRLGGPLFATPGSGYVTISNNAFACFHRGIHVYKSADWCLIDSNWFQNFFVEGPDPEWREYIQANASAMFIERADALAITNNGVFGHLYGIQTNINADAPTPAEGIAERLRMSNNDFDKVHIGIYLVAGCTGSYSNGAIVGDNVVGSFAIQANARVRFKFANLVTINHGIQAILAAEDNTILDFSELTIINSNVDGSGGALFVETGAYVSVIGKFHATPATGTLMTGGGTLAINPVRSSGGGVDAFGTEYDVYFANAEVLTGHRKVTLATGNANVTMAALEVAQTFTAAQALSVGGSLDGTFGGNPIFSGAVRFSGNARPLTDDAAALGTSTVSWSDLFLATGGVINWVNGDVTITHAANSLAFAGASNGYTFDATVKPAANDGAALGTTTASWSDLFLATGGVINWDNSAARIIYTTAGDEMDFLGAAVYYFDATIRPFTNDAGSLGSGTLSWSDLYLASGGIIDFNNGDVTITHSANLLAFAGASSGYTFDAPVYSPSIGVMRFKVSGVNFNSANTDNAVAITLPAGITRYLITRTMISNASASISTATVGVFTSTGGGGQTIAANQAITVTATAADTNNNAMQLTATNANTMAYNDATLYVRVGTAQGSAATADVIIDIYPLS